MDGLWEQVQETQAWLKSRWAGPARAGLILGTGLGELATKIKTEVAIAYSDIPHFPRSTAPSHAGKLLCGTLEGISVMAMEGRIHYYEGYSLQQVTFPIRVMKAMGADTLVVTSAVGGMNRIALELGISAHIGVLVAVPGPNLETRAEYRMLRMMGADIVGMSTVPECIAAVHAGLKTVGFSIVTDMCLPDALEPADISKILKVAAQGGERLEQLLLELFRRLDAPV